MSNDVDLDAVEASWGKAFTIPSIVLDDAPLKEWMVRAHNIFAGETWENLDALVCRLADVIPEGVSEENYSAAEPLAKACGKWFSNVEKLRTGLNRPLLDLKKAIDSAAKETVSRASPTLQPIIDAVDAIKARRKAEKAEREAAEAKRIADEAAAAQKKIEDDRKRAEEDHRKMIEAEHAAERKRLDDIAKANRIEADKLVTERKETEELKRWLAEREAVIVSKEDVKVIVEAPHDKLIALPASDDIALTVPEFMQVMEDFQQAESVPVHNPVPFAVPPTKLTGAQLQSIMFDAETSAEFANAGVQVQPSGDQQKVRDFGSAIKAFIDSLKRPLLVKHEARQAVELAVFDVYGIANSLQEWRMS